MHVLARFCIISSMLVSVLAAPHNAEAEADIETLEHVVYKRDDVLTPRDIELAARHGVDIDTMYRHSVFKRSDGDDVTIWVHNSFTESDPGSEGATSATEGSLRTRGHRLVLPFTNRRTGNGNHCGASTFYSETKSNSPGTGGANDIMRWSQTVKGSFSLMDGCCSDPERVNLIIAGSNTGNNMRFSAGKDSRDRHSVALIGSTDIGDITRDSKDRFQRQLNGGWRLAARGGMRCDISTFGVRPWVNWVIDRTEERV